MASLLKKIVGLDHPPYTIESIFSGKFDENTIEYMGKPKTKDLLLPFQDENTWKLLNDTFVQQQPKTSPTPKDDFPSKSYPDEILHLESLFHALGGHKGEKFCAWLHQIRVLGTGDVCASMDISKIGSETENQSKNPDRENGEEIYTTFFNETLPFMKRLILSMPQIFKQKKIKSVDQNVDEDNDQKMDDQTQKEEPLSMAFINPNSNGVISLTRGQIASILCCCWFGIKLYSHCSYAVELSIVGTPGKLQIWLRYFDYVRSKGMDSSWFNDEKVTIWRRTLSAKQCANLEYDTLCKNDTPLCDFKVFEEGAIEDQAGQIHADFANQYIGGGVLEGGNVQEEIRFTVNPECVISKWLCPLPMRHNEAILIFGSQQLFDYKGYGSRFSFAGYRNVADELFFCEDKPQRLGSSVITGIDAVHFHNPQNQIRSSYMMREVAKSYVAYSVSNQDIGHQMDTVSTGNWGCGIFRGDPQLKAMLQWISATLSGRKVAYYTFGDRRVANGILKDFIAGFAPQKVTVGALWSALTDPKFEKAYRNRKGVAQLLNERFVPDAKTIESQPSDMGDVSKLFK